MIGRIVGNYRIAEKIGEGGMGAVYRAVDLMLEREVALKAIRPELAREPQIVERFRSEARTLARLTHPAIANVYTFFYEEDELFLAMELVPGRALSRVLQEGAMPWPRAVQLLASAMEGIELAHRAGIVHRDLKPDNLMVTATGTIKVMDFGIARVIGSGHLTHTGLLVGTLRYMAPEQIRGEEVDGRTDVYALGSVLYEMLTGRTPFEGTSDWAILRAQIEETPRPPGESNPDIPWWLDRAVLRALAKQPVERFQSVEEMRICLLRQGETAETPRPDPAAGAVALEEMPTLVTPPGSRTPIGTPSPLPEPPPLPAAVPTMRTVPRQATPVPSSGLPPVLQQPPGMPPMPPMPPPPPNAALTPPRPLAPAVPTAYSPTSYRPVELVRKTEMDRKVTIAVAALFAVVVLALVVLKVRGSLAEPPAPSSETTATSAPPAGRSSSEPAEKSQTSRSQPTVDPDAEPALSTAPTAAPSDSPTSPRSSPRVQDFPFDRQASAGPAAGEASPEDPSSTASTPAAPSSETYNPPEPVPLPSPAQPRLVEMHRLAGEIEVKSAELVETYGAYLGQKEDSGAELTTQDEQLKDDLDAFQDAAETFNRQFQIGFFGRLRGRRPDDRPRIGQRYGELSRLGEEVDGLMAEVHPSPEVLRAWQDVRRRWKRVAAIIGGF